MKYQENMIPDSISLAEVVKYIATCLEIPAGYGFVDEWRRFSSAARLLNMALHHSTNCPRWLDYDPKKQFSVFSDSAAIEGIEILTAATELSQEKANSHMEYGCPVSWWDETSRQQQLGFVTSEIIEFLDRNGINHDIEEDAPWTWEEISKALGVSKRQAHYMDEHTSGKYINKPGKGGRNSHCLTNKRKLRKMNEDCKELKKK